MKSKKVRTIIVISLLSLSLIAFIYSIFNIIGWYIDGKKNEKLNEEIYSALDMGNNDNDQGLNEDISNEPNLAKLKELNSETVAYIKVNGTNIDYPVVKHKDNFYYLTHSFDKSYNQYGWIYANYENKFDGTDRNITLFGHNMKNGSMFGSLKNVLTSTWQNNEENLEVLFIIGEEAYTYKVFSTYKIYKEEYFATANFASDSDFKKFIDTIKKRSNKNYKVDVNITDQILTLSTCYKDNNYRVILHAKKL